MFNHYYIQHEIDHRKHELTNNPQLKPIRNQQIKMNYLKISWNRIWGHHKKPTTCHTCVC